MYPGCIHCRSRLRTFSEKSFSESRRLFASTPATENVDKVDKSSLK